MLAMSAGGGGIGAPAGFLARISSLEREVSFLKQKVEDDARWKHILQQWVLDNFAFDIQGTLLHGHRRRYSTSTTTVHTSSSTRNVSPVKRKSPVTPTYRSKVKVERIDPVQTRYRGTGYNPHHHEDEDDISPTGFIDEEDDDPDTEQVHCFGGVMEDGMEVNVNPKDLIITPDICLDKSMDQESTGKGGRSSEGLNKKTAANNPSHLEDVDDDPLGEAGVNSSDDDVSDSSSEEEQHRRPHRKMEWTLIGTYQNVEAMKQQFNLREWGLSTKQITGTGAKIYYYCKECRKHGPGRLLIRYKSEDSEVEVLKNQLEHDHSTKKRLTEEMKVEIVNLYKAGMTDSPKILAALKISKPHMRQPTVKQVCHILKPFRRVERKHKMKEKKKAAKVRLKQKDTSVDLTTGEKKNKKSKGGIKNDSVLDGLSSLSTSTPSYPQTSGPSTSTASTPQQQQHLGQFMTPEGFQRPHIVSVTGFPTPSQQLQQFYQQQQHPQQHSPFDQSNNNSGHLGQHYP